MSTGQTWQTISTSSDETSQLGELLGQRLRGGEVIEMVSDLGGGKTTFVKGLARGIGSQDVVRSPSFTLSNEYLGERLRLYHFDFYRLNEAGIMRDELAEAETDERGVVAVEWADIVRDVLPANRLTIKLRAVDESSRKLAFSWPASLNYLFPLNT